MGRGLSADEKRVKLLEIFQESKDFYQLKELEKLAPKLKGIVSQSVKEVLQTLVDDGLVQSDKVGASNWYAYMRELQSSGAFLLNAITAKVNAAKTLKETTQVNLSELKNLVELEKVVRPDTAERAESLAALASKRNEIAELQKEMAQYGACDPVQVETKKRAVVLAHEAAVRWTDNYSILRSDFMRRTGVDSATLETFLGISNDFEDIS